MAYDLLLMLCLWCLWSGSQPGFC